MFGLWWIFIGIIVLGLIFLGINILVDGIKYGWYNLTPDSWECGWIMLSANAIIAIVIFLPICIFVPIGAKQVVKEYQMNYEMIQEVIESGSDYDNISISQTIIEYNAWLTKAKTDKEMWGTWSQYVYEDLDSLNYLLLKNNS